MLLLKIFSEPVQILLQPITIERLVSVEKGYKGTVGIVPSKRQIEWQKTEFYGFSKFYKNLKAALNVKCELLDEEYYL